MKIGGFLPFSFSDFPGIVSAVVFTQGCNFRCPFCHNSKLIGRRQKKNLELLSEEEILSRLMRRSGQIEGVVITGGEPTLQKNLITFVRGLKSMGFKVKMDTNGSRPEIIKKLINFDLVDYFAMDIKAPFELYDQLSGIKTPIDKVRNSINLISKSGIGHEFRTTYVEPLLCHEDIENIKNHCLPKGSTYKVQPFRPEDVKEPLFFPVFKKRERVVALS